MKDATLLQIFGEAKPKNFRRQIMIIAERYGGQITENFLVLSLAILVAIAFRIVG